MITESEEPSAFSGKDSTEWKFTVRRGWGLFHAYGIYSVTSPDQKLLVQLSKYHNVNYEYAMGVVEALNRIYSNTEDDASAGH